jgi:hypothetical protein
MGVELDIDALSGYLSDILWAHDLQHIAFEECRIVNAHMARQLSDDSIALAGRKSSFLVNAMNAEQGTQLAFLCPKVLRL